MITMTGEKMASRVAASMLRATGLEELVCNTYSGKCSEMTMFTPVLFIKSVKFGAKILQKESMLSVNPMEHRTVQFV